MSSVIMVHSYKGGTGKSAVAINLAKYLASKQKKTILLIEQDIGGPSLSTTLNITPKFTWNDFYESNKSLKELIHQTELFDVICSEAREIQIPADQDPRNFYTRHLERFYIQKKWMKANYDYIILDTHPGFSIDLINSISVSDIAILLTRLDIDNIYNTIKMYDQVYKEFKTKRIILVQNQVPKPVESPSKAYPEQNINIEKAITNWEEFLKGKEFLSIPLENEIAYTLSRSKILSLDSLFMDYIKQLVQILQK